MWLFVPNNWNIRKNSKKSRERFAPVNFLDHKRRFFEFPQSNVNVRAISKHDISHQ